MSWLKNWLGRKTLDDSAMAARQPGQKLMTLDERMAFRREMVFEAMRDVLVQHGLPPLSYKLNVARLDSRGHRFAVMVDLVPQLAGRVVDAPGEWQVMENQAAQTASSRYRVRISNVYWRLEPQGFAAAYHVGSAAADGVQSKSAPATVVPAPAHKTASNKPPVPTQFDDFPDTQLDDRIPRETSINQDEPISQDELVAFEQAILRGQASQQPVHLGSRTYQTDYMPLV
ncbi:MAG: hypothetical protein K2W33_09535 [Burkholderiales bacterium]|nr:hypothetical protein [Burkholderiales bacterium]